MSVSTVFLVDLALTAKEGGAVTASDTFSFGSSLQERNMVLIPSASLSVKEGYFPLIISLA